MSRTEVIPLNLQNEEMMESVNGATAVFNSEWLSLDEAAAALGKSASTIERLAANERLRSKLEPRAGRKPERLYNAEDVAKLKAASGAGHPPRSLAAPVRALPPAMLTLAPEMTSAARELVELVRAPQPVKLQEKLWLSLEEAAAYSGLGQTYLRDSCVEPKYYKEGENLIGVRGGPHHAFRIQRASLEAFQG